MGEELEALRKNRADRERLSAERDELIVAAKSAKVPVTHIAKAVGLSAMQVHRVLNEHGAGPGTRT